MKVEVDINGLELKIAVCNEKSDAAGFEEDVQYWRGRADSFMDVLCSYLGVTDAMKIAELEEKIIEKYKEKEE